MAVSRDLPGWRFSGSLIWEKSKYWNSSLHQFTVFDFFSATIEDEIKEEGNETTENIDEDPQQSESQQWSQNVNEEEEEHGEEVDLTARREPAAEKG